MAGLLPDDRVEWRLRPASGPREGARTTVSFGSATAAGLKRLDDSFQTDLDVGSGISALVGLAGRAVASTGSVNGAPSSSVIQP